MEPLIAFIIAIILIVITSALFQRLGRIVTLLTQIRNSLAKPDNPDLQARDPEQKTEHLPKSR